MIKGIIFFKIFRDYIDHHLLEISNETDPQSSFYKDTGGMNTYLISAQ